MKCRSFIVVLVGALAGCAALFAAGCAEEQGGLEDYIAALGRENQLLEERNEELKTEHDWLEGRCEEWRQEIDALTEGKTYNEEQIAETESKSENLLAIDWRHENYSMSSFYVFIKQEFADRQYTAEDFLPAEIREIERAGDACWRLTLKRGVTEELVNAMIRVLCLDFVESVEPEYTGETEV